MVGREDVGNDPKSGRPSTAKTQESEEKVGRIVRGDRRLSIRAISETKRQSMHCKSPQSPRKKKASMSKSKFKDDCFFSISGG